VSSGGDRGALSVRAAPCAKGAELVRAWVAVESDSEPARTVPFRDVPACVPVELPAVPVELPAVTGGPAAGPRAAGEGTRKVPREKIAQPPESKMDIDTPAANPGDRSEDLNDTFMLG